MLEQRLVKSGIEPVALSSERQRQFIPVSLFNEGDCTSFTSAAITGMDDKKGERLTKERKKWKKAKKKKSKKGKEGRKEEIRDEK